MVALGRGSVGQFQCCWEGACEQPWLNSWSLIHAAGGPKVETLVGKINKNGRRTEDNGSSMIKLHYIHVCDDINMLGAGNGTIRRSGLVGVGVVLFGEVCHCGCGL